ncbi:MAG TPA: MucR family transcriptional regulator [Alphaproteobacteria bacterium]|nr:MucR family transcriptional regulator [Alphaproteobacteria bacterium]
MDTEHADWVTAEEILRMTAEVVSAYLSNNLLPAHQISEVIHTVHTSLKALGTGKGESTSEPPKPAVPVKKSVTPDYIVCLEDGKKLKMLKRHLRSTYGMTPEEYRAKWGLPADYPMVAPNYARQRSEFAKQIGLGRNSGRGPRRGRGKQR